MDYVFQKEYPILPSVCDASGRLSYPGAFECFMDIATQHADVLGVGLRDLSPKNLYWLTVKTKIAFLRRPEMGEYFDMHTWAYKFSGIFGQRNFLMETPEHETLAYADSRWFYFDSENGKPTRIDPEESEGYGTEPPYEMDYSVSRKVAYPDDLEKKDTIYVNPSLLDSNQHLNNGQYVRLAVGYLPLDFDTAEFRAEYRNAAHYGDEMTVYTKEIENRFYVVFTDETKEPYFISEFTRR